MRAKPPRASRSQPSSSRRKSKETTGTRTPRGSGAAELEPDAQQSAVLRAAQVARQLERFGLPGVALSILGKPRGCSHALSFQPIFPGTRRNGSACDSCREGRRPIALNRRRGNPCATVDGPATRADPSAEYTDSAALLGNRDAGTSSTWHCAVVTPATLELFVWWWRSEGAEQHGAIARQPK